MTNHTKTVYDNLVGDTDISKSSPQHWFTNLAAWRKGSAAISKIAGSGSIPGACRTIPHEFVFSHFMWYSRDSGNPEPWVVTIVLKLKTRAKTLRETDLTNTKPYVYNKNQTNTQQ